MGLLNRFFKGAGHGTDELARRLGVSESELLALRPEYHEFHIRKRSGGQRRILAPAPNLKAMQRRILHRLLALLVSHEAAIGFERGRSIVSNAVPHRGKAVIVKMDIKVFFHRPAQSESGRSFDGSAGTMLRREC